MSTPRKIILRDGTVRYRIVADAGRDPETGRRRQVTRTFDRRRDAQAELDRIGHERAAGTYVPPSRLTVAQMLDGYLQSACFEREEATRSNYSHALRVPRERLGERLAQSVTREDIEALRDYMLTAARKRGGQPGTGLGPRSVRLAIGRLSAAFEQAVDDGKVTRNPCRRVRLPKMAASEKSSWEQDEAVRFLAAVADDRLLAAWLLALCGLRREEICGLMWPRVDLTALTLTIARVRVMVDGRMVVKDAPKSERGARTLPLLPGMVAALRALRKTQAAENLAAGPAYADSGYVVVDELGEPVSPGWLSDEFGRLVKRAGLRRITLHETRHTASTLMEHAGVPDSIRAAWCGHTVEVNRATYLHASPSDLAVARDALASLFKIAEG